MQARTWMVAVAVASVALVSGGVWTAAGAQTVSCAGDKVVTISGVRLLNQDGSRTAGPLAVDLEPGIWTVTAGSHDGFHGDSDQVTQPNEQWQIVADSGWASPFTIDVPDDAEDTLTVFDNQVISSPVSSITVSHMGVGGINSVEPTCIGFTMVEPARDSAQPGSGEAGGAEDAGDSDTEGPDGEGPQASEGEGSEGSEGEGSEGSGGTEGEQPSVETPGQPDGEDVEEVATPTDGGQAPGTTDSGDDSTDGGENAAGSSDDDAIEPEVAGQIETAPAPELAVTGPTSLRTAFGAALVLFGLGGIALLVSKRNEYDLGA